MRITIHDIAREAGVSIATVSKAINNRGRMNEKTRQRILDIMRDLNYHPSVLASAMKGKSTFTVGLLIADLANPFSSVIARSIEDRGKELGYSVIICNTDYDVEKESWYISVLKQKSVDGIISAAGFQNQKLLSELVEDNFPIALITREHTTVPVDTVIVDDYLGGYEATSYLIRAGHKKIGTVVLGVNSGRDRLRGFHRAMTESGLQSDEQLVKIANGSTEDGKQAAIQLLDLPEPPTAVVAGNDMLAIGVMLAAKEKGLKVPDDLSVIGFDNTILAEICSPPLTTMSQPIRDMGRKVMDLLVQEINRDKNIKKRIVMTPELVVRESVKRLM